MKTQPFSAYENESDSLLIGDLTVENRLDRLSLYGSLDITKDTVGLQDALKLKALLDATVRALQNETNLPERIEIEETDNVANPFL
ncbi:MAG: hypothetical protein NTY39_08235 [Campylobacterales bacterium]|nr:hypothetical protein [Campylobacterales bacterium]